MIYISGKITGNGNYKEQFNEAENFLKLRGFECFNPSKMPYDPKKTWYDYMLKDIPILCKCDSIYMLKGWRRSKGARLEHYIAKKLKLKIFYQCV